MDYWTECVATALEDAGIVVSDDQLKQIAEAIEAGHGNYGLAHGYDLVNNRAETDAERKLLELKAEIGKREDWRARTVPCRKCYAEGRITNGYGLDIQCSRCFGSGRVPI